MRYLYICLFLLPILGVIAAGFYIYQTKKNQAKQRYASGVVYQFSLNGSTKAKLFSLGLSLFLALYLYVQLYDILTTDLSVPFSKHILRYLVIYIILAIDIVNFVRIALKSVFISDAQVCIYAFRQPAKIYPTTAVSSIKDYNVAAKSQQNIQHVYIQDEVIFSVTDDDPSYVQFCAWAKKNNIPFESVIPSVSDFF